MTVLSHTKVGDQTDTAMTPSERLDHHLRDWLGAWPPPTRGVTVVGSPRREEPGWDGRIRPVRGVQTPEGTVLSVPPAHVEAVAALGPEVTSIASGIAAVMSLDGWRFSRGVFRWCDGDVRNESAGVWVSPLAEGVPEWLHPFNGEVLVAIDGTKVAAGVGRKIHDRWGHELAVVTEPGHRGRGWARRLVAQAAAQVLSEGAVPTYLHGSDNIASARTADAAGFPDRGWKVLGLFEGAPG